MRALLALVLAAAPACGAAVAAEPAPAPAFAVDPAAGFAESVVRGVNHAHIHRRGSGYGSTSSARELERLKDVGVDWIAVTPYAYQPKATSDGIVGYDENGRTTTLFRDPSLTDDDVAAEIRAARARGLKVVVKPHVWAGDFWGGGEWHGTIRQLDEEAHARWWRTYRGFVLHNARIAARAGADAYCLGTELVTMTNGRADEWRALARDVRAVFPGHLTYAAHWDRELSHVGFWDALDVVGVSAYFPLQATDDATVDDLVRAWAPHEQRLASIAAAHGKPVVFMELGFRAATGSFRTPWAYDGGVPDELTQAKAYEATFRALGRHRWWRGAFLWKTFTDPARADEGGDGSSYSFRGKLAERVVAAWYGRRR